MSYDESNESNLTRAQESIQPSTQEAGETAEQPEVSTIYMTDGELLPWKNRWWRVHLQEVEGTRHIELEMLKPTAACLKRSKRAERWNASHAKLPHVKRELRHIAQLWKLSRGGGDSSGSVESQPA